MYPIVFKKSCFSRQRDEFSNNDHFRTLFSDGADYSVPAINIKETEGHFEIEVAAPGQRKEDFRIALEKNMLTISTEKESQNEDKEGRYTRREFRYAAFSRSFILPDDVDQDKIKANHSNGILKVELPKMKPEKKEAKTIQVS